MFITSASPCHFVWARPQCNRDKLTASRSGNRRGPRLAQVWSLRDSRGEEFVEVRLIGLSSGSLLLAEVNPTPGQENQAVPLPLSVINSPTDKQSGVSDARALQSALRREDVDPPLPLLTKFEIGRALFSTRSLYDEMFAALAGSSSVESTLRRDAKVNALARVWGASQGLVSKLEVLQVMVEAAADSGIIPTKIILDEEPNLAVEDITIGVSVRYRTRLMKIAGFMEDIFEPGDREVALEPTMIPVVVALGLRLQIPIYVTRSILKETSTTYQRNPALPWNCFVNETNDEASKLIADDAESDVPPPWNLSSDDAMCMSLEELRSSLRVAGIPSRRRADRNELIEQLLPLLDEIQRRRFMIKMAVAEDRLLDAEALYQARSLRHQLTDDLDQAVAEERFDEAAVLRQRLIKLTEKRADPTQDENTYDPYLDQDEWYP